MLTKENSFASGKPRNYPEMWAKLAAVLNSVQTKEQYAAADAYTLLWHSRVAQGMGVHGSVELFNDLRSMLREVQLRVGA